MRSLRATKVSAPVRPRSQLHDLARDRPFHRGHHLVEQHLGIAERSLGPLGEKPGRRLVHLEPLALDDRRQLRFDLGGSQAAKIEPLHARDDRVRDLLRFGRREHEHDMGRRLLEGLQECVEAVRGDLVHFVDDVELGAARRRREAHILAQLPDLVDARDEAPSISRTSRLRPCVISTQDAHSLQGSAPSDRARS